MWIAIAKGDGNDPLDKVCLGACVKLAGVVIGRIELCGYLKFKSFVLARVVFVIAKIIAKRQCPSFFVTTSFDYMNVVGMWPAGWPMEKWAARIVGIERCRSTVH